MIKKKQQYKPVDLTGMGDDEIYNNGESFAKELKRLLDAYKPYFGHHDYYEKLYGIYYSVKAQLDKEERIA